MVGAPVGTDERTRAGASNERSETLRQGSPCALRRLHAGKTTAGAHRHRIPRGESTLPSEHAGR